MPGWVGAKQRCSRESEVGTSSLLQAQPEDFLSPKDEEQKLGNSGEWTRTLEEQKAQRQALETRVADLGRRLQEARDEARTAGQQLAIQAMVRPGPPHVDV